MMNRRKKKGDSQKSLSPLVVYSASFLQRFSYCWKGIRGEENPKDDRAELSLKKDIFIRLFSL